MKLVFKDFRLINEENYNQLTNLEKEQMLLPGKACFEAPGDDFIHNIDDFLDQTYEGNCELWAVVSEEEPEKKIYNVWVVNVDSAVVFYTNTTKDTGVGMIQNYFGPIDKTTEQREKLADALQTAFNNRPDIDYLPEGPAKAYQKAVRDIIKSEELEKTKNKENIAKKTIKAKKSKKKVKKKKK